MPLRRLLLSLLTVLLPVSSWAGVVWRGDFETGNIGQYTSTQRVSADRLQVVQAAGATSGSRYVLKATVRQGDNPINASGTRNELVYMGKEREGSEYYYRWQVKFAPDYPSANTWQVFTQWHHEGCCGSPPVEFFVKGEEIRLTLTNTTTPWKTKLVRGEWQDFIFHVKWSSSASVGFVELWHNGKLVLSKLKHATMYPNDGIYLKLGLYRSDTVQPVGVVYHDGFTQATAWEDVKPADPTPVPVPPAEPTPAEPDAGTSPAPDAGEPEADAGAPSTEPSPIVDSTSPPPVVDTPTAHTPSVEAIGPHVGCTSAGGPLGALGLLGLGGLLRRSRRR